MPKNQTSRAFIGLGSNLQDPEAQVNHALLALGKLPKTKLVKASSLYKTSPVGYIDQQDFINAVAEISTALSPLELLDAILNIETEAGRERPFANAPRVLDCDLLLYDDIKVATEKLTLPHPRMFERGFVLLPLAEISPNLTSPSGESIVKLAFSHQNQGIEKIENSKNSDF